MTMRKGKRSYADGTLILYGRTGVCRVEGVTEKTLPGEKEPVPFYLLRPLYQSGTILAPVEKVEDGTIFSRPIISREQARTFIESLPDLPAEPYHNQNLNQLRDYYRQQLQSLTTLDMARLIRSIYAKRQEEERRKRRLSVVDQRFMEEAETLLYGELAAALDISREEVCGYIGRTLRRA